MKNKIISFTNQKGGVGKSTLCTLFTNYLVEKGHMVQIFDCDPQHSIFERRQHENENKPKIAKPYRVVTGSIESSGNVEMLLSNIRQTSYDALFDTPPGLDKEGRKTLLQNSDWIIIPFQYELTTCISTNTFLQWLKKQLGNSIFQRVILVPNRIQFGIGNAMEKEQAEIYRNSVNSFACVTEDIPLRKDLERVKTAALSSVQHQLVDNVFDFIYQKIFNQTKITEDE